MSEPRSQNSHLLVLFWLVSIAIPTGGCSHTRNPSSDRYIYDSSPAPRGEAPSAIIYLSDEDRFIVQTREAAGNPLDSWPESLPVRSKAADGSSVQGVVISPGSIFNTGARANGWYVPLSLRLINGRFQISRIAGELNDYDGTIFVRTERFLKTSNPKLVYSYGFFSNEYKYSIPYGNDVR